VLADGERCRDAEVAHDLALSNGVALAGRILGRIPVMAA
jgi:hypothetical protein